MIPSSEHKQNGPRGDPNHQRRARAAAHRAAHLSFGPGAPFAVRQDQALLGAAIGLAGRATRPEIRRIARRASRRVIVYDHLWAQPQLWRDFVIEGRNHLDAALARGAGLILVPSHFGPYRWIAPTLLRLGLRVALLVDPRGRGLVEADVAQRMDQLFPELDWSVFEAIDSGEPAALWQLARALRAGRATLLFADGNSGVDGLAAERGAHHLTFLGQSIRVRPGIGALAAATDAAILPVFCQDRGAAAPILRFDPPILRRPGEPKKLFTARAIEQLFAVLEREILAQPDRWEEWGIFPRWLEGPPRLPAPPPPPSRPPLAQSLTQPALVGRRIRLLRDDLWLLDLAGRPELVLLAEGRSYPADPALASLIDAAEADLPVLPWLRGQPDQRRAHAALHGALAAGLLGLHR
jgi:lauroyl/myristoyl acyltransferase